MPELIINQPPEVDPAKAAVGHVLRDKDGDLYLRTDGGLLYLRPFKEYPIGYHTLPSFAPYVDLGSLTIKY